MHYYQFNIPDWTLGTAHLSLIEEAIYFRLINYYYDTEEPIPLETQSVIRRLRLGSNSDLLQAILDEFFTKTEKGYVHTRCDENIKSYKKNSRKNAANGAKGGRPRKDAASSETQQKPTGLFSETQAEPKQKATNNHKPITNNQEPRTNTANAVNCSEPVSSKPPADDSPIFISIPTNKFNTAGEERPITENKISEWQSTYPGVDVRQTLIRIRSWVVNNPNKRKTFSGIFRFIDTWLAKEQNQFGGQHATSHQPHGNNRSAGNRPFAEIVGQQARDVIQRLGGNGSHGDPGSGTVRQDGSVVSEQGQV